MREKLNWWVVARKASDVGGSRSGGGESVKELTIWWLQERFGHRRDNNKTWQRL